MRNHPSGGKGRTARKFSSGTLVITCKSKICLVCRQQQAAIRDSLPVFLQAYSTNEYKPDGVLIFGTQVENTDLYPETANFIDAWNREYAYPRLDYATLRDFLKYVDENFGTQLPTYRGDGGPYWEDGAVSDAYYRR